MERLMDEEKEEDVEQQAADAMRMGARARVGVLKRPENKDITIEDFNYDGRRHKEYR